MLPVGTGVCPTALTEPAFIRAYTYRPSNAVHLQRHASKQRRAHRLSAKSSTDDELSERLKRAEAEAKDLRERLAAAGSGEAQKSEGPAQPAKKPSRIDGSMLRREGGGGKEPEGQWLSESVVNSLFKGGPSELLRPADPDSPDSDTEAATVRRRLIIGGVATAGIAAFALIPTDSLRISRPAKALYLYLIPLLRAQELLTDVYEIVTNGRFEELQPALARIKDQPTELVKNMRDALSSVPDGRTRDRASILLREVVDDLDAIDYTKYYSTLGRSARPTGADQARYADFSGRAVKAAQSKIGEFLAIMPSQDLRTARQMAAPPPDVDSS